MLNKADQEAFNATTAKEHKDRAELGAAEKAERLEKRAAERELHSIGPDDVAVIDADVVQQL